MSRRSEALRAIALETLAIVDARGYTLPNGRRVELGDAIARSIAGTRVHSPGAAAARAPRRSSAALRVTDESTLAAVLRLGAVDGGPLAALSFASATKPGGEFESGAEAQEESLARSSALHACLAAQPELYARQRAHASALYLDHVVFVPGVPFFRDEHGALLETPAQAAVLSAAAPNAAVVRVHEPERTAEIAPVLARRAELVLDVAVREGVARLVLGAWGCGVFQNEPAVVARAFAALLGRGGRFEHAFDEVVFAVLDRSTERRTLATFAAELAPPRGA
ncbi:MAG: TIGR02452 family protein [Planctomycetes bacterium]|nr:TIGR02452 family protein [Planctomycetota bacterium]